MYYVKKNSGSNYCKFAERGTSESTSIVATAVSDPAYATSFSTLRKAFEQIIHYADQGESHRVDASAMVVVKVSFTDEETYR